jgi:hypothetical protein
MGCLDRDALRHAAASDVDEGASTPSFVADLLHWQQTQRREARDVDGLGEFVPVGNVGEAGTRPGAVNAGRTAIHAG